MHNREESVGKRYLRAALGPVYEHDVMRLVSQQPMQYLRLFTQEDF